MRKAACVVLFVDVVGGKQKSGDLVFQAQGDTQG